MSFLSLFLNRMENRHQNCGSRYGLTFYGLHSIIIIMSSFFIYRFGRGFLPQIDIAKSFSIRSAKILKENQIPTIMIASFSVNIKHKDIFFMIQFTDAERSYLSDCETDDGITVANDEFLNGSSSQQLTTKMRNRSPITMRQSSPFPNEMTNRRMQQYNNAQERLRNGEKT